MKAAGTLRNIFQASANKTESAKKPKARPASQDQGKALITALTCRWGTIFCDLGKAAKTGASNSSWWFILWGESTESSPPRQYGPPLVRQGRLFFPTQRGLYPSLSIIPIELLEPSSHHPTWHQGSRGSTPKSHQGASSQERRKEVCMQAGKQEDYSQGKKTAESSVSSHPNFACNNNRL